jgi:hypothetical protein
MDAVIWRPPFDKLILAVAQMFENPLLAVRKLDRLCGSYSVCFKLLKKLGIRKFRSYLVLFYTAQLL